MTDLPTLQTARLILRPFSLGDAGEVQRLAGDVAVADTTLHIPHPYEDGAAEEWIGTHGDEFAKGASLALAITCRSDGALVGAIGLMDIAAGHQAEMGYWVGKPYWSRGFCTEAARAVLRYAFTELGLIRVYAHHFTRNPASGRVMQKLGMKHEGSLRQHAKKGDNFEDLEFHGILKEEWAAARP